MPLKIFILNSKEENYKEAYSEISGIMDKSVSWVANLANFTAVLHRKFNFWWTGFYLINHENILELGPFQGPAACLKIPFGKGVCGSAWKEKKTIVVEDVHKFEGHIACSAASNSEIVVPLMIEGEIIGVLDIDSVEFGAFDSIDKRELEALVKLIPTPLNSINLFSTAKTA